MSEEQGEYNADETQEAMDMLGKGASLSPRDEAKKLAFHLINATQDKIDAFVDAIIYAAKEEMRDEISEARKDESDPRLS